MKDVPRNSSASCVIRIAGPTQPLRGLIRSPGNKNTALPALVAAALSQGAVELKNVPNIGDIHDLCLILRSVGIDVLLDGNTVTTNPRQPTRSRIATEMSSRIRGSVYALAVLARHFSQGDIGEIGGDNLSARTLEPHMRALAGYGIEMRRHANGWGLLGGPAQPGEVTVDDRPGGISASCLALLIGAALEGRSVIRGVSRELEVLDLVDCVNSLGGTAVFDDNALVVEGPMSKPHASWSVPGDHIYCATMAIAAALTGGEVRLPYNMARRMPSILQVLEDAGVDCSFDGATLCIRGRGLRAVTVTTAPFPGLPSDIAPQMAVLLTQVHGTSELVETVNIGRWDHLEGLRHLGAELRTDGDRLTITGSRWLKSAQVRGAGIRETAALVLASLVAVGTTVINDAQALFRGYEDLPRDLASMGAIAETVRMPHGT